MTVEELIAKLNEAAEYGDRHATSALLTQAANALTEQQRELTTAREASMILKGDPTAVAIYRGLRDRAVIAEAALSEREERIGELKAGALFTAQRIIDLAFKVPAPNSITPQIVVAAQTLERLARSSLLAWNRRSPPQGGEEANITNDGPHKLTEHRRWLARQLLDSKLSEDEAYDIIRYSPAIHPERAPSPDALARALTRITQDRWTGPKEAIAEVGEDYVRGFDAACADHARIAREALAALSLGEEGNRGTSQTIPSAHVAKATATEDPATSGKGSG